MPTNLGFPIENFYNLEELNRVYHRDIAELRINDNSIDENIRLRDTYFKNFEDNQITYSELEKRISDIYDNHNLVSPYLDPEDQAIRKAEIRQDPTIEQIELSEHDLFNLRHYQSVFDKYNNVLERIDKDTNEYQDIKKLEKLLNDNSSKLNDVTYFKDIILTNSDLDNNLNFQFTDENDNYQLNYNEHSINSNPIKIYNYEEELDIRNKLKDLQDTHNIQHENTLNKTNDELKILSKSEFNDYSKIVETNENVFFFGQEFSNFHEQEFSINGIKFNSSEQALMFSKAKHFNDDETAQRILNTDDARECEQLGKIINNVDPVEWSNVSDKYMNIILKNKFESNQELKTMLTETKGKNIVECSPLDENLGIGISVDDAINGKDWKGENKLGNALMTVRDDILLEEKAFKNDNVRDNQQDNSNKKELLETLKKNKEFVDKVDEGNSIRQENNENKIMHLSQKLEFSNDNLYSQSYETKNAISELSFKEKIDLYNQAKDIDNMTDYDNQKNVNDISNQLQTKLIISEIEKTNDSEMLNSLRKDYLVSDTPKPATKDLNFENSNLSNYLDNSNNEISNLNKPKLDKFIENANKEIKHINYNEQANKIKNNKAFKQYYNSDKSQSQSQNKVNDNKEVNQRDEEKEEKSKEKKNRLQR
ncbi:NADAR family protein [Staphylococcus argenteus]|uniref:NADAR family protein n=1 Tax=Staphylococcus argenteus TaxID=985002 RepID=UPI000B595C2C|nr:NADAR family protein [Staphylococcus argenteus]